ncbi:MAG TPA: trypsin-like peptidase domain-containing protein [Candidatus Limnocylindrales bacterium]|nr:trypsin-like peptidase domain-containing protein [Candidatus Limnocylindrales bacterium]
MTDQIDASARPPDPGNARRRTRIAARARRTGLFAAGILAAFIAILVYGFVFPLPRQLTQADIQSGVDQALASETPPPPFSELVYDAVAPSLVTIQTTGVDAQGKAVNGLGSGVVVDAGGDILTALHVVTGATTIKLTFADGTTATGTVSVRQPDQDIAVVQPSILSANVVPATLGNPRAVQVGSEAYVVGHPFGLVDSLSAGVVSGLDRSFQEPNSSQVLHGLIQVDAAINPGNSGGPLLNRDGQVVGIVTGLVNPTSQDVFIGIGLAVPIDVAGGAAGLPQY